MASSTLLNLDAGPGSTSAPQGPRPFLSHGHLIGLRVLSVVYVVGLVFLVVTNYPPLGSLVFRLSSQHLWFALTVGIVVSAVVLTFMLLFGLSLYHFLRGHVGAQPPSWWLWVILLLNVAAVVVYYLRVLEPEQRALLRGEAPASAKPESR
jgi:hypothetical protein